MTSIYNAIDAAADLDSDTAEQVIHTFLTGDLNRFGSHVYSSRMLAFRDAINDAFAGAGITANALVIEHATRAAYYSASGATALASIAAETVAAQIAQAEAA